MKNMDKKLRGEEIKKLTNNGKNRTMVKKIERLMADEETLKIMNALFAACAGEKK